MTCSDDREHDPDTPPFSARTGHFLVGMQGLALLRLWLTDSQAHIQERIDQIKDTVTHVDEPPLSERAAITSLNPDAGYDVWATTYNDQATTNRVIAREEKAVLPLLDSLPAGKALAAACGTGRHTRHLLARGHHVIAVGASPTMLDRARSAAVGRERLGAGTAEVRLGWLDALPVDDASVDLAVCALALTHCADLAAPVRELARTVRRGGS